jgi:hypothetical protein
MVFTEVGGSHMLESLRVNADRLAIPDAQEAQIYPQLYDPLNGLPKLSLWSV